MTAPVYWARSGKYLNGRVTETEACIDGDSILRNLYQLPNPSGQLWERLAERDGND